jgi:hypothetical protein
VIHERAIQLPKEAKMTYPIAELNGQNAQISRRIRLPEPVLDLPVSLTGYLDSMGLSIRSVPEFGSGRLCDLVFGGARATWLAEFVGNYSVVVPDL